MKVLVAGATGGLGRSRVVLRYASFYGPPVGSARAASGEFVKLIEQRRLPVIGDGSGVWSFIHYDDAADATVKAVESRPSVLRDEQGDRQDLRRLHR